MSCEHVHTYVLVVTSCVTTVVVTSTRSGCTSSTSSTCAILVRLMGPAPLLLLLYQLRTRQGIKCCLLVTTCGDRWRPHRHARLSPATTKGLSSTYTMPARLTRKLKYNTKTPRRHLIVDTAPIVPMPIHPSSVFFRSSAILLHFFFSGRRWCCLLEL